jgi:hypothetical protein
MNENHKSINEENWFQIIYTFLRINVVIIGKYDGLIILIKKV